MRIRTSFGPVLGRMTHIFPVQSRPREPAPGLDQLEAEKRLIFVVSPAPWESPQGATVEAPGRIRRWQSIVLAILHQLDAENVVTALEDAGHRLTRIPSIGGFLKIDNVTLLMAVDDDKVDDVVAVIERSPPAGRSSCPWSCRAASRTSCPRWFATAEPPSSSPTWSRYARSSEHPAILRRMSWLARSGNRRRSADDAETRQRKGLLVPVSVLILPISLVWGSLYLGLGSPGRLIAYLYFAVSLGALLVFARTRDTAFLLHLQQPPSCWRRPSR